MIVGVDEVGRGCLAGPVCVAAVVLADSHIEGLTDSKKLSAKTRERLASEIKQTAPSIGIGWVSAKAIDQVGMSAALKLAAATAVRQITVQYEQIIIDGTIKLVDNPKTIVMKKADLLIKEVSAASIIAKVARDRYMSMVHALYPDYGFAANAGYGTAVHLAAIERHGPSPLHRMSFAPLAERGLRRPPVLTSGALAEQRAAAYLTDLNFKILDRNWRTKWCEIDLVAEQGSTLYFVETKYRTEDSRGGGLAYITPKKQQQMQFAAELYMRQKGWSGDAALSAIEVAGPDFTISRWLPNIDAA